MQQSVAEFPSSSYSLYGGLMDDVHSALSALFLHKKKSILVSHTFK